jgi:antitoxin CcdA
MKARTNVSIDRTLLERAREDGIVLSALLEDAIRSELALREEEKWKAENREAIASYNRHVEKHGVFSDGMRSF